MDLTLIMSIKYSAYQVVIIGLGTRLKLIKNIFLINWVFIQLHGLLRCGFGLLVE